jgi:SNF2 family DNA or RNA helicase
MSTTLDNPVPINSTFDSQNINPPVDSQYVDKFTVDVYNYVIGDVLVNQYQDTEDPRQYTEEHPDIAKIKLFLKYYFCEIGNQIEIDKFMKNDDFVDFLENQINKVYNEHLAPKIIGNPDYYGDSMRETFDIYGNVFNVDKNGQPWDLEKPKDKDCFVVLFYFYKVKDGVILTPNLILKNVINHVQQHYFTVNCLPEEYDSYREDKFLEDVNRNTKLIYSSYSKPSYCKTPLFFHQMNNISKMLYLHEHNIKYYHNENFIVKLNNGLILELHEIDKHDGQGKVMHFIDESEIPVKTIKGGMIFDEPGTGKTIQFILYLLETYEKFKSEKRSMILVPNDNIKQVWYSEFEKHIEREFPDNIDVFTFDELQIKIINPNFLKEYYIIGIDEIHILYTDENSPYMKLFHSICESKIDYMWGITGTPFVNDYSMKRIMEFISKKKILGDTREFRDNYFQYALQYCVLKNKKIDMETYEWPDLNIENKVVNLDDFQQAVYDAQKITNNNVNTLRKLACSLQIVYGDSQCVTPNDLRKYIKNKHEKNYDNEVIILKEKEKMLDEHYKIMAINDKYREETKKNPIIELTLKKNIEIQKQIVHKFKVSLDYITESCNKVTQIVKNPKVVETDTDIDTDDDLCPICYEQFKPPITYFKCGHYFCKACANSSLNTKYKEKWSNANDNATFACMYCNSLSPKSEIVDVSNVSEINLSPKVHSIVTMIQNSSKRFIIFSQFDDIIEKVKNCFDKLTIRCDIYNGKVNEDCQVLILSSNNNAEGIHLTMFDNLIIFEPFEPTLYYKEIEQQLIARIHRVGRTGDVNVYRMITSGTIEEDIYKL